MRFFMKGGAKPSQMLIRIPIIAVVSLLAARFLLPALFPFLIALAIAALLRRPTLAVAKRTRAPRRLVAALTAVLAASLLFTAIAAVVRILLHELGDLAQRVLSGENALIENLGRLIRRVCELLSRIPLLGDTEEIRTLVSDTLVDAVKSTVAAIGAGLPEVAARLAAAVPQALVFCTVTLISCVYLCMDYDSVVIPAKKKLGARLTWIAPPYRDAVKKTLSGFLRSLSLLFLLTFFMLLAGFLILREPYALLLALLTALIDSLPVFGIGAVLLPMSLYRFFIGNTQAAVGLCILFALVTVIRQLLEPRLLGARLGLHPLLTLIATYAGLKLFGIAGMILLPPTVVIAKNILEIARAKERVPSSHDTKGTP